jgi:hypothetical protein
MLRTLATLTVAVVALAGCAGLAKPSVRSALVDAGARPRVADCMAERMTDRLSIEQLQKLKRVEAAPGEKTSDLSAVEIVERVSRVGDPEVVAVTASAGAVCSVTN